MNARELIARRAAKEIKDGQLVNLGFGMPTQASNYLPEGVNLMFHGENGVIGVGATEVLKQVVGGTAMRNAGKVDK